MSWAEDFSLEYYEKILEYIKDKGRRTLYVSTFPRVKDQATNDIILRHDVDLDLTMANTLAHVERGYDVKSTYMVMLNNPFYDTSKNRKTLFKILDCGHEIGLHYYYELDTSVAPVGVESYINSINEQCNQLEEIIEEKVKSLAFHRQSLPFFHDFLMIGDRVNATSKAMMKVYISDSMGRWREGEPIKWLDEFHGGLPTQILTHPVWWGWFHQSTEERLKNLIHHEQRKNLEKVRNQIYEITDIKVWI